MSTHAKKNPRTIPSSPDAMEFGATLRAMRNASGMLAEEAAQRLEISRGYLSEIENGKSTPSEKIMKAIHRVFDVDFLTSKSKLVSLHSAVSAAGSKKYPAIASPEPLKVQERSTSYQAGEHWRVPIFRSVLASAGNGSGQSQLEASEEHLSFSHQYMRRHFGRVGDGFAMIYVRGDSMQPGLFDGDEIVIDTQQKRVDRDGIYVITLRGDLKVKRIQQRLDGSLLVKSDNLAYETEAVSAQQAEEFSVVGRMVWPRLR